MGGGKSGGDQVVIPTPMKTTTSIGNQLDAAPQTLDESKRREDAVDTKKLGTIGLRIPLQTDKSTTTIPKTAATSGVQV
jgi:hypothetical protein